MSSPTPGPEQQPWGPPPGAAGPGAGSPQPGPGSPYAPGSQYGSGPQYGWGPQHGNAPQYGNAPQWGNAAQPGGGWGDPPARRPGSVTGAAVVGIVFGSLVGVLNLVGLLAAGTLDVDFGIAEVVITIVVVALSVALAVGGIRVLAGRDPRLLNQAGLGLVVLWLVTFVIALVSGAAAFSGFFTLVAGAVVLGLLRNPASRHWFASRGQSL
ncbi:hypothetical protein [Modestobacter sp. NPDC049651]|uniref:hypothetical protein n=1 Tax=unclassified Modestobacter TaxID=2643866 RepID=UPI0033FC8ABD